VSLITCETAENANSAPASRAPAPRHFHKITGGLNVAPILAQLDAAPDLWGAHRARLDAPDSPHATSADIWVRYNDIRPFQAGARPWSEINNPHIPIWYPAWYRVPALRAPVMSIMALSQAEMLGGVLITRVPAGGRIAPHIDTGWHVETYSKFYVCLKGAPGAEMLCEVDGEVEAMCPKPGDLHLFDNRKMHWVENRSDHERMTLIVCVKTDLDPDRGATA